MDNIEEEREESLSVSLRKPEPPFKKDSSSAEAPSAEKEIFQKSRKEPSLAEPVIPPEPPSAPPEISETEPEEIQPEPKKKSMVLFIVLGLVGILVFGLLISLFLKKGKKEEETTLTYWGLWEPEPAIQGIIAQWEEENPQIKVRYIEQDKEDYRVRLQSALAQGSGPDIFRFHNTWLPMFKSDLAPLPGAVVSSLGLEADYFSVSVDSVKKEGQFYGLPLMVDALALYYNKDLLSAANKSPPRTWWGLETLAKELTVRPEQKITLAGVALGTTNNIDHWSDIIGLMIYQNEGDPGRPDALVEDVLKYYLKFAGADMVWDETLPQSTLAFGSGKLVFYFGPSWRVFNLLEINPNLNFGITGVPQLPKLKETSQEAAEKGEGELTSIGWGTFWLEGVWAKSKNQEQAWRFLEFLGSKETLQKLYTAQSQIRLFGEIYPRTDLASSLEGDLIIGPFVSQAKIAKTWYLASFTHDGSGINERMIKYYEDAINGLGQGSSEKTVLETLASGINQILAQYNLQRF